MGERKQMGERKEMVSEAWRQSFEVSLAQYMGGQLLTDLVLAKVMLRALPHPVDMTRNRINPIAQWCFAPMGGFLLGL